MAQNRQFRLRSRPVGRAVPEDFEIRSEDLAPPDDGEILVKSLYLSLDPVVRTMLYAGGGLSYAPSVGIGEVVRALGVGEVIASSVPAIREGDCVTGWLGIQEYARLKADSVTRIDPAIAPLPRFLGALGLTGRTAYFGLLDICQPRAGETVVVSGAAGATGSMVGQIAKIKGCRAVGIAGGVDKCRYLTEELGFDAALDYKSGDLDQGLELHCPSGVDVYFDNVGGEILDTVLLHLARKARIAICGRISQLNDLASTRGPRNYGALLAKSARMEGFTVLDFLPRWPEADGVLAGWLASGDLKAREHIVKGLENFPFALNMLFEGQNVGKLILEVEAEPEVSQANR